MDKSGAFWEGGLVIEENYCYCILLYVSEYFTCMTIKDNFDLFSQEYITSE